jgi:6-phosphofructokinase 1
MVSLRTTSKIEIIEALGGNKGWLPAASALFKQHELDYPNLVYLPDRTYEMDTILADCERAYSRGGSVIMIVPDHFRIDRLEKNPLLPEDPVRGNNAGVGYRVSQYISAALGIPTRVTAPYALYRIAPGYTSRVDFEEARELGQAAVSYALQGYSGGMVGLNRVSESPYKCEIGWVDLHGIAGQEKPFPDHYWDARKHMPTQAFLDYVLPLADGDFPNVKFEL